MKDFPSLWYASVIEGCLSSEWCRRWSHDVKHFLQVSKVSSLEPVTGTETVFSDAAIKYTALNTTHW